MTQIDPKLCRDNLARLLVDEIALLTTLEKLLAGEHLLLTNNDVDGLDKAGSARQDCVARLLRVEDERRTLCRMLDRPADLDGMQSLIAWCDTNGSLLPALQECADRATRCREQNDRNGMLVSARLQRVSNMLGMLDSGSARQSQVYGPAAGAAVPQVGRMVAARA